MDSEQEQKVLELVAACDGLIQMVKAVRLVVGEHLGPEHVARKLRRAEEAIRKMGG